MESTKYASVRVKVETYREMKQLALDAGIPFTRLMDEMLIAYKEKTLISPCLKAGALRESQ